jgi:GNAT superfamily N-acetyltransferase
MQTIRDDIAQVLIAQVLRQEPIWPKEVDLEPKTRIQGHVRRIWLSDEALYRAHLLRLDRDGRIMRFAGAISDETVADYSQSIGEPKRVLHGYFDGSELRGAAELVPLLDAEHTAEAAFSVEQGYRRLGIGHELMARTIRAARTRGIKHLLVRCLPTNRAMQNLARKFAADLVFESGDVLGLIDPPPATGATYADEAVDGLRSLAFAWFEPLAKAAPSPGRVGAPAPVQEALPGRE